MSNLIETLSGAAWREILLTLAHSLWQGAVIAIVLALVLGQIAGNRPQARYLASLAALAGLVLSCLVTWSILDLPAAERTVVESIADSPPTAAVPLMTVGDPMQPLASPDPIAPPIVATPGGSFWQAAAASCSALWIAGTSVMLLRMIWLVSGARRLARRPTLADPRVLELVERLRRQLGIVRRIVVVEATTVGPAVLGVLRPVLLLPPAICGELPGECLEAILAHELAHIRRHDYLVNLVQMLVEAALFFNPAVWWINRQIRREREACCDALAVQITGQPLTYADALAAWVEHAAAPELAIGFSNQRGGGVLDRIQRLLVAGYRPELRGSWPALTAGLSVSLVLFVALWSGTRAGVALAAEILSPQERIEQLAQERDELRPVVDPNGKAFVSGTIRTEGGPAVASFQSCFVAKHPGLSSTKGVTLSSPEFSQTLPSGATWIIVSAAGYAPTVLGPLQTRPGDVLADLDVVLRPGFSAEIHLVDPQGAPVIDAAATAMYSELGVGIGDRWRADEHGVILLDHLADAVYQITIEAPGVQTLRMEPARFKPDEVLTRSLLPTVPTQGVVVSPDGKPINGAAIRCLAQTNPNQMHDLRGPVLATTDSSGRFVLDKLDDGSQYALLVEAPDHSRRFFPGMRSGQSDLRWVVGPPITVIGHVEGDLNKLERDGGQPAVSFSQTSSAQIDAMNHMSVRLREGMAKVKFVGGKRQFQITDLAPGELWISAGEQRQTLQLAGPTSEITIDLDRGQPTPALRHVVLRFVGADKGLSPSGQIWFSATSPEPVQSGQWRSGHAAIARGRVEFDAPAPGSAFYRMENVVGYWFDDGNVDVPAGDEPLVHDVAVVAAGAIRGWLFNADGTPAVGTSAVDHAKLSAQSVEEKWRQGEKMIAINDVPVDAAGEFFISPLPLGRTYVVRASRGFENTVSQPLGVDAATPNPTVELKFSPARDLHGQLLGPDGQPLAGIPLELDFSSPGVITAYSPGLLPDREGRFGLKGLSTGAGTYRVTIKPTRDFQPLQVDLAIERPTIEIHLKAGHVIAGRLIDAATSKPLAGLKLHATLDADKQRQWPYWFETEEPQTDAEGRFRFSTLPEGNYGIQVSGAGWTRRFPPPEDQVFHTGETVVELRVTPPQAQQ